MSQPKPITSNEFSKLCLPSSGLVLVQKHSAGEKRGSIYIPRSVSSIQMKWASTGIIVAQSLMVSSDQETEALMSIYIVGTVVGFNATTPIQAPIPPMYEFKNPNGEDDNTVMIHVKDICNVFIDNDSELSAFKDRVALAGDLYMKKAT